MIAIECTFCGLNNKFDQPHAIHAGFANQGFLYNDAGNRTLVWSSFDPAYEAIVGRKHPWTLTAEEQHLLESALSQSGENWKFANPARCANCSKPISGPIMQTIYYLLFPNSIVADLGPSERSLGKYVS